MNIIPAILPKNRDELVEKLRQLSDAGYSGRVQIDLCDGKFVESMTWPFSEFSSTYDFLNYADQFVLDDELFDLIQKFDIDYDLMVIDAEHLFSLWDSLQPKNIIIHLDALTDTEALAIDLTAERSPFEFVKNNQVILAISQTTDISLLDYWYHEIGMRTFQIMGIDHIGKQGEQFSDHTIEIIQDLQKRFPDSTIQVDGGVNQKTIGKLAKLDINAVVAGSAVFAGDIQDNLQRLQKYAIL
jgi:ribulose-phosphate 3-epimerase